VSILAWARGAGTHFLASQVCCRDALSDKVSSFAQPLRLKLCKQHSSHTKWDFRRKDGIGKREAISLLRLQWPLLQCARALCAPLPCTINAKGYKTTI